MHQNVPLQSKNSENFPHAPLVCPPRINPRNEIPALMLRLSSYLRHVKFGLPISAHRRFLPPFRELYLRQRIRVAASSPPLLVAKAIDRPKRGGAVSDRQHLSKYVRVSSNRIRLGETRQQFRLFCRHELTKSLIPSAAQSGIQISQIQVGPKKEATIKLSIKSCY